MKLFNYLKQKITGGLKEELIATIVIGILVSTAISTYLISSFSGDKVEQKLVYDGLQVTKNFADRNTLSLLYLSEESAKESVQAIENFTDVQGVGIYDVEMKPLIEDGENTFPDEASKIWPKEIELVKETDAAWYFVSPVFDRGTDPEIAESPFIEGAAEKELLGYVRVYVSKDTLHALENSIFRVNLSVSLLLSALLVVLLSAITDRVTKPLKDLSYFMRMAEEGDLKVRSKIWGPKDIIVMQHAFNTMIHALADREEKLESARNAAMEYAHAKGEFAANVSHELRTPLNGILGMLEILKDTELSPKQEEYVSVAHDSGDALFELIDDILNFSKIDSGKASIEYELFNLRETLDDIVGILTGQTQSKELDIAYLVDKDVPANMHGDASRIRQLLLNLAGNAIKFTDHGEIGLRIKNVTNGAKNLRLRFEVIDTGVGIADEAQDKVFEAFQQADASTTKKFGGTGLGLAICSQLVEVMNGDIGVESSLGNGSTFWFELPFKDTVASEVVETKQTTAAGLRIFVVDDSEIIRANLQQTFETWGAYFSSAADGDEAIEILRKATQTHRSFDVAFIDEIMPGINGIELIRNIVKDAKIAPLKLVLMTTQKNPDAFVDRFREIDAHIKKPIRQSHLFDGIAELLNSSLEVDAVKQVHKRENSKSIKEKPNFNATLLVVEDNRANQQVVQAMLERLGCRSSIAANGFEALKLLESAKYDAVFMDCNMPQMDGYEATQKIRQMGTAVAQIPIIAMTANVLDKDRERCIQAGMDDYTSKPIKFDVLIAKLERWLKLPEEHYADLDSTEELISREVLADTSEINAIDDVVIAELRENIGDGFDNMVEVYIEDMGILLRSLEKSVLEEDSSGLTHYAHSIKGSSSNFGASRLRHIAKQLEDIGRSNTTKGARNLVQLLFVEADVVTHDLKKELGRNKDVTLLSQPSAERILIAEDDRSSRLALQSVLVKEGYEVEAVTDGAEAVLCCEKLMPDLILIDALMPNLNGFEACKKIRMLKDSSHVPILIVTALDDEESIEQAFNSGATDYIPKPIHFSVMRQRISRLLKASRAEVHVRELAYNDSLTGLPNRTMFIDKMHELLKKVRRRSEMFAVMFLDLDRFKYVNDTLGHSVGDMLLKSVAERILSCVRSVDTVARLGGDEFTLVFDGIEDQNVIAKIADKICRRISEPYSFVGKEIYVTASIGISLHPQDGEDIGQLMRRADTAMFRAKERGGSYLFYEKEMEVLITNKLETEHDLRLSIEREELEVYYQPKIDLQTSNINGMEALVRWEHPEKGQIGPNEFIPLAEETGLISEIGLWVLITACVQVQEWIKKGHEPIPVSVNISGRQLENSEIAAQVAHVLARSGLKPEYLELEITESTIMKRPEEVISILHQLKAMGVKLSIDDFGTGYSSLNYLRKFPIDILKIDATFVHDITENNEDRLIVKGIIALAKSLNLGVIAEGVETKEQFDLLREEGCESIQGFYIGKPMASGEFEKQFILVDRSNIEVLSNFRK